MKIGMFKQVLSEEIISPLSECFMVMDIMSDLGTLSLSSIIRWKACKPTLRTTYIGQAQWKPNSIERKLQYQHRHILRTVVL